MFRRRVLLVTLGVVAIALVFAWNREKRRQKTVGQGAGEAGGQIERCLVCHSGSHDDPGGAHAAASVGCSSCHLGNRLAFDKRRAHEGMEPEPGALSTVDLTCGRDGCHQRESARVATSLMATGAGIIAVNRWVFGERDSPDHGETMSQLAALTAPSPSQDHLRKLCAGCHLHARSDNRDDAIRRVGTGCSACHFQAPPEGSANHGTIDGEVTDQACLGCHSRSGRIALSYQGLAELEADQPEDCAEPTRLHDGRPACRLEPDVHHDRGLGCIDCHLHTGLMGDGTSHTHKEDQVEITCESCHGPHDDPAQIWATMSDPITKDILRLRNQPAPPLDPVRVGRRGTPVWNLRQPPDGATRQVLLGKGDGEAHPVTPTPADPNHQLNGHERLTCSACHSPWAPRCASCHTHLDPEGEQWDFAEARPTSGAWLESADRYDWGEPTLAVRADGRIVPAVPGMVLTVQIEPSATPIRRRLFAAIEPHTTRKEARSCPSCHRSAVALGWGKGVLRFDPKEVHFEPDGPDPLVAGIARDGWTAPFPAQPGVGTRTGLRSLTAVEQRAVLEVGRCLGCHDESRDGIYRDFAASLNSFRSGQSACAAMMVP